jgi:hypothetical protein
MVDFRSKIEHNRRRELKASQECLPNVVLNAADSARNDVLGNKCDMIKKALYTYRIDMGAIAYSDNVRKRSGQDLNVNFWLGVRFEYRENWICIYKHKKRRSPFTFYPFLALLIRGVFYIFFPSEYY